ncbi:MULTISPECIES: hypothetical protein [Pseudoalteromonas]|uniref:hypothetical protein n=1 Tax=Pseudoalteromonas TaxID=53246 RepID=UPI00110AEFBE|nr:MULTISPECIES: hypothetical protein [Pseudoalteromonas]TMO43259.1 hypothetical protein CWC24_16540 [Pseudoalteromonas ruthenica]TMO52512.1 hypothetical protein CWC23_02265 [Pseudoalteromonas ruthenica]
MRELLVHPDRNYFSQGSIFEGLKVLEERDTKGIVITARCDIANQKARNILCLPIYEMNDWMSVHGNTIIFRQTKKKLINKIQNSLTKFKEPNDCYRVFTQKRVLDEINKKKSTYETSDVEDLISMLNMYYEKKCDFSLNFVKKARSNLISNVINNKEASTYFIEQVDMDNTLKPYVIDLSEPISIPIDFMEKLKKGIKKQNDCDGVFGFFNIPEAGISYISTLKSPYIEHLLQKFSQYYSRIGTEDICSDALEIIEGHIHEA